MTTLNTPQAKPAEISVKPARLQDPQGEISREIVTNPALKNMRALTQWRESVGAGAFSDHVSEFGYSILNRDALRAVSRVAEPHQGKVISVFTGLGYAEAQMVAAGLDVIGFDKTVSERRWLLDTHEGPKDLSFSRFSDRALFMSFPEVSNGKSEAAEFVEKFLAAGGSSVIVVTEARPLAHAIKTDSALVERLAAAEVVERIALPKWPTVACFMGYGNVHSTFEPVLTAYRFR